MLEAVPFQVMPPIQQQHRLMEVPKQCPSQPLVARELTLDWFQLVFVRLIVELEYQLDQHRDLDFLILW